MYQKKLKSYLYILLFISYALVSYNIKHPSNVPIILQSHVFYGACMLYALDMYLFLSHTKLQTK